MVATVQYQIMRDWIAFGVIFDGSYISPSLSSFARARSENLSHMRRSVMSMAGAINTRPATLSGRSSAASVDSQPPKLDPTRICGPCVSVSRIWGMSPRQWLMVPSVKVPVELPWPKYQSARNSACAQPPMMPVPAPWCRPYRSGNRRKNDAGCSLRRLINLRAIGKALGSKSAHWRSVKSGEISGPEMEVMRRSFVYNLNSLYSIFFERQARIGPCRPEKSSHLWRHRNPTQT